MRRKLVTTIIVCFSCVFFAADAHAVQVRDGFVSKKRISSNHFDISVASGVDVPRMIAELQTPSSIRATIKASLAGYDSYTLGGTLDILFEAVSSMMDIRLRSFRCQVKICKDQEQLSLVGKALFGVRVPKTPGFYVAQTETFYIDAEHISIYVFGHELAHAVQCRYFVVPPPEKIQEVLSGYVEYEFRKYARTLPGSRSSRT